MYVPNENCLKELDTLYLKLEGKKMMPNTPLFKMVAYHHNLYNDAKEAGLNV